jgi:hypothetical protein
MRDRGAKMLDGLSRRGGLFHMKHIITDSIMPKLDGAVCAGCVFALALFATSLVAVSPASAGRQVHGGDVAKILTGKSFVIQCVDGTIGRGQISMAGVANVSYRRPSDPREETDHAVLKVKGVEICLAWKQFGGGGGGCYPVSEEAQGRFRLSTGPLWCDISPRH